MTSTVGTHDVLLAKEARFARQQQLLSREGAVLVQVALNLPGGHALYSWRELLAEANGALTEMLTNLGLQVIAAEDVVDVLGPCSRLTVLGDGLSIKQQCIALEETTPRGRLWDIDVITPVGPIDRHSLGVKGRTCWVCGDAEAHVCRRLGMHLPEEVVGVAQNLARRAEPPCCR